MVSAGLFSQARSTVRSLFVTGGATTPASNKSSLPRDLASSSPTGTALARVEPSAVKPGQSDQSDDGVVGEGVPGAGAGASPNSDGNENGETTAQHTKRAGWTCWGVLQVCLCPSACIPGPKTGGGGRGRGGGSVFSGFSLFVCIRSGCRSTVVHVGLSESCKVQFLAFVG